MRNQVNLEPYKEKIKDLYLNGKGINYLRDLYHTTQENIRNILINNNVKIRMAGESSRIYNNKDDFFDTIDVMEKAYFLGLFYADGWISHKEPKFSICLQEKDKSIIELFNKIVLGNRPLNKQMWDKGPGKYRGIKSGIGYRSGTSNKQIYNGLIKNGCIPKKSFTIEFPTESQVPYNLINHFIRGYFDGDGSIMMKNKYGIEDGACISIICSINFGRSLYNIFLKLGIKMSIEIRKSYSKNMCILSTAKKDNLIKLFNFLYKDSNEFKLERKYNKFVECIDKIKDKKSSNARIPKNNPLGF